MRRGALIANIELRKDGNIRTSLYRALRNLIASGSLRAGSRLPSTRTLARDLGISRNSVLAAFERLAADGLIVSRHGSGVFVSPFAAGRKPRNVEPDPHLRAPKRIAASPREVLPAIEHFPLDAWQQCMRQVAASITIDDLRTDALHRAIAEHFAALRGVHCEPEQIAIFATKQEAIGFATDITTDLIHCPATTEGKIDVLRAATRAHAWVLEDDHCAHFATEPTLHSADRHGRVLYLGTFGDVLPGVDLAFLVLPRMLATCARSSVSPIEQLVLARFIDEGHLAASARRLRAMVRARRQVVVDALRGADLEAVHHPLHVEVRTGDRVVIVHLAELFPPNLDGIAGRRRIA